MITSQVLLVDDNPVQGATRSAILTRAGARVSLAQAARQALDLLERPEFRTPLKMIVTDHLMPGMNGPELVRRVREILPSIPILVVSGLPEAEAEYDALDISFHLKPFAPDELIRITQAILGSAVLRSA